jgi:hypothetical protein
LRDCGAAAAAPPIPSTQRIGCSRRDAVTLVFGRGASAPDRKPGRASFSVELAGRMRMIVKMTTDTLIQPIFIGNAIEALENLKHFVTSTNTGLELMSRLTPLREELQPTASISADDIDRLAEYEAFARNELESESPYLYGLAVIRLVTILETVVSDACLEAILRVPAVRQRSNLRKIEGPLLDFAAADEGQRAELLLNVLAETSKAKLKAGVGRYEPLLDAVGIGIRIADEVRTAMFEMLEVRNVLTHRNGRADARLMEKCAWLNAKLNEPVLVSKTMFDRYLAASQYVVVEILDRWLALVSGNGEETQATRRYKTELLERLRANGIQRSSG